MWRELPVNSLRSDTRVPLRTMPPNHQIQAATRAWLDVRDTKCHLLAVSNGMMNEGLPLTLGRVPRSRRERFARGGEAAQSNRAARVERCAGAAFLAGSAATCATSTRS